MNFTPSPEQEEQLKALQQPMDKWAYPRILVGIPLTSSLPNADWVLPFVSFLGQRKASFVWVKHNRIDIVRNHMAIKLLEEYNKTHLLMLDPDHTHPEDIIERLARWVVLDRSIQVVGGLNFCRNPPHWPAAYMKTDEEDVLGHIVNWTPGLLEVGALGGGSILINRKCFEAIPPPWFYNSYAGVWSNTFSGEDIGFSTLCRHAGIRQFIDTTTTSPHHTIAQITEETFREQLKSPEAWK
jgi:hypothetical protein